MKKIESVLLDDGRTRLEKRFGKYEPNLVFLYQEGYEWVKADGDALNIANLHQHLGAMAGSITYVLYGDFFKSKKGTDCFRIKDKDSAKHILLKEDYTGCRRFKSAILDLPEIIYSRQASSNGGGAGNNYIVLPNKPVEYSIDKI